MAPLFGLHLPSFKFPDATPETLFDRVVEQAQATEAAGFDLLTVMDHFYQITMVGPETDPMLEAYSTLAALAQATTTIKLGALVTGVTYRNPAMLAKMVTTLDTISKGRAILGIGAAWNESEHAGYGFKFPPVRERMDRLGEALTIAKLMFTEDRPSFTGKHYQIERALNVPRPIQPGGPKILVGGGGERRTLRLAAQYADACNIFDSFEVVRRKLAILTEHCREIGRDPSEITKTRLAMLVIAPTASEADQRLHDLLAAMPSPLPKEQLARMFIAGDPGAVSRQVQAHLDAGVDGLIFSLPGGATPEEIALAGRTLAPRFV